MAEAVGAPRLEMRGVGKRFGATIALDGADLTVHPGEVCALVGQNGAGKSTLMAILAGAIAPDEGTMRIDAVPYAPRDPFESRRAGVAMIHQELSLAPHLSVMENIVLGIEPVRHGFVQRRRMRDIAIDAMRQLGHDDIRPDAQVSTLQPAAQQLVEIARALATGCRVLVLDEPTSSLGPADVRALFDLIGRLKARGMAIVYISHFIEEVKAVSDRFVVLRDGRNAGDGVTAAASAADIVAMMVGRTLDDMYPRGARTAGEPMLQLDRVVPGSATLTLHRGEILGIAGLLGSGRTRLLRAIFGLEPVTSGAIVVGAYSGPATPHDRWRQGVGLLSEDRAGEGLALGLSVADNMTLTSLEPLGTSFAVLPSRQLAAASRWIDRLGIRCAGARQTVGELSGGNQQKVAVARLLHHDVDVLVLDEPTRGIDVASKAQIYALLDELVCGTGDRKAVLLVSSYLPELLGVCDRIAVMSRGRLGPARPVEEWTEHSLLMHASGARAAS
ncbi:MAG TPA: sugar ABC transporter ATP-binding protein [Vicinamibacterales bacterium]|jgi:ribose transport system ATP-binding protein|nr:sugar ABC transporter ATP-binding protein [Vicinamibacterales bacterium]